MVISGLGILQMRLKECYIEHCKVLLHIELDLNSNVVQPIRDVYNGEIYNRR